MDDVLPEEPEILPEEPEEPEIVEVTEEPEINCKILHSSALLFPLSLSYMGFL